MQRILLFMVGLLLLSSCRPAMKVEGKQERYQLGDDSLWASKHFDDSKWPTSRGEVGNHIFWARTTLNLLKRPAGPLGLHIQSFGAFEVYWDGVKIGSNGQLIHKDGPELPGTETTYYHVPDSLSKVGVHTVALRMSQSLLPEVERNIGFYIDNYNIMLKRPLMVTSFMNLMAGAFLIAAIYYFFLYLNSPKSGLSVLIFGVICFLFFALLMTEYLKFYIDIPYTRFFLRLHVIGWLTFALTMLIPAYFTIQFHFRWKAIFLVLLFISLMVIYMVNYGHFDFTARTYTRVMWFSAVLVVLTAIYQKEKGAIIVCIGLFVTAIVDHYINYDFSLFINFTLIVLCMLYLHALRTKAIEEEYKSSLLLSSRLKLELVKKNIQPHFLKNTLTSLIDWVEESPKQGAEFIQALAGEFDIMNRIADEKLIPIRQEIELCKTHLKVMHFRKEINYTWTDHGIIETEQLPPALIHTLLENGITHCMPTEHGFIGFELTFSRLATGKQYVFKTIAQNRPIDHEVKEGNGFGYVKARLAESYGNHWQLSSAATAEGWQTTINIYDK